MQESVKQDREKYIGGSDIPIIMNLSPFKTRYSLLLEKAGYKEDTFEGNIYTEYGNKLEPKIREYVNKCIPDGSSNPFTEGKHSREASEGELIGVRIHTDGEREVNGSSEVLEIKTTSDIREGIRDYKIYLVQLLYYMYNLRAKKGVLAVYERPEDMDEEFNSNRLQLFFIEDIGAYEDILFEMADAINSFIEDLGKVKANPFITEEELLPQEIPEIAQRVLAFEYQLSQLKKVEAKIKEDKAKLKQAMEVAGVKSWTTPNGYKITLVPDGEDKVKKETKLNEDALKEKHPKIYKQFLETSEVIQRGKTGYIKITPPKDPKEKEA